VYTIPAVLDHILDQYEHHCQEQQQQLDQGGLSMKAQLQRLCTPFWWLLFPNLSSCAELAGSGAAGEPSTCFPPAAAAGRDAAAGPRNSSTSTVDRSPPAIASDADASARLRYRNFLQRLIFAHSRYLRHMAAADREGQSTATEGEEHPKGVDHPERSSHQLSGEVTAAGVCKTQDPMFSVLAEALMQGAVFKAVLGLPEAERKGMIGDPIVFWWCLGQFAAVVKLLVAVHNIKVQQKQQGIEKGTRKELRGFSDLPLIELQLLPIPANRVIAGASFQQLLAMTKSVVRSQHQGQVLTQEYHRVVQDVICEYEGTLMHCDKYFLDLYKGALNGIKVEKMLRCHVASESVGGDLSGMTEGSGQAGEASRNSARSSTCGTSPACKSSSFTNSSEAKGGRANRNSSGESSSSMSSGPSGNGNDRRCDRASSSSGSSTEESSDCNSSGIRRSSKGDKISKSSGGESCSSDENSSAGSRDNRGVAPCSSATSDRSRIPDALATYLHKFRAVLSAEVMALCLNVGVLTFDIRKAWEYVVAADKVPRSDNKRQLRETAQQAGWAHAFNWFRSVSMLFLLSSDAKIQQFAVGTAPVLLPVLLHMAKEYPDISDTGALITKVLMPFKGKWLDRGLFE
jgi:hypothetical protein